MSPKRRGAYKPPRDRREVLLAVMSALAIVIVTSALVWVLRPNQGSGSSPTPVSVSPSATSGSSSTASSLPASSSVAPSSSVP